MQVVRTTMTSSFHLLDDFNAFFVCLAREELLEFDQETQEILTIPKCIFYFWFKFEIFLKT